MHSIATEISGLLNATEAAKVLSIDRGTIERLTNRGLLRKYFSDQHMSPLYHPRELSDFLGRLRRHSSSTGDPSDLVDIPTAARRVRMPIARVVAMLLEGKSALHAADPETAAFKNFRVSVVALRESAAQDPEGTVNPTQAAKKLRVNVRTIRDLLDKKHLNSRMIREKSSGRERRYVCSVSLERFMREHITVVGLAEQTGRLPGAEAILQLDRGVQPIELHSRCNTIFRRKDVAPEQPQFVNSSLAL